MILAFVLGMAVGAIIVSLIFAGLIRELEFKDCKSCKWWIPDLMKDDSTICANANSPKFNTHTVMTDTCDEWEEE